MTQKLVIDTSKRILQVVLMLLFMLNMNAQHYPINVRTQLIPPYTLYLSDYTRDMSLTVTIQPLDLNIENYRVKLFVEIKSDNILLTTNSGFIKDLYINGNEPIILTGDDLGDMFAPQNLTFNGTNENDFFRTGKLPEGFYTFTFMLYDYYKDIRVSQQIPAMAFLVMNDPPLINEPYNKERIRLSDPQNIFFQWTPRHTASPNSAFSSEYEFSLYEVLDKNMSPGDVVLTGQPLYSEILTTTSLIYGLDKPQLIPGKDYVFRVQARDIQGRDLFKNNGYSEVYSFTFGSLCLPPTAMSTKNVAGNGIEINWAQGPEQSNFDLQYRKQDITSWTPVETDGATAKIYELVENEKYYVHIKSYCGTFESDWSYEMEFTAPPKKEVKSFECSGKNDIATITNTKPLANLKNGDLFIAGDYSAKITKVSGGNGIFSGECIVTVPFYANAYVPHQFTNIKINSDYEMVEGELESLYNPDSKFVTTLDQIKIEVPSVNELQKNEVFDEAINSVQQSTTEINDKIESVDLNNENKNLETIASEASNTVIDIDKPLLSTEEINTQDIVNTKDAINSASENLTNGNSPANISSGSLSNTKVSKSDFLSSTEQIFGFDAFQYDALKSYYKTDEINSVEVYIPWKAIKTGSLDYVNLKASDLSGKTISVSNANNQEYNIESADEKGIQKVTLSSNNNDAHESEIKASYIQSDSKGHEKKIEVACLNLVTYDELNIKLILVSVNGASIDNTEIETALNKIYNQAVVTFNISNVINLKLSEFENTAFDNGGVELISSYSTDMNKIIDKFKNENPAYDKDAYYLFFLPGDVKTAGKSGHMPLNSQFGFIFSKGQNSGGLKRCIAQEIGHGAFGLAHTWNEYSLSQSSTNNLMDNNNQADAIILWKPQWDKIHNAGFTK
jgi:hypothetical protein